MSLPYDVTIGVLCHEHRIPRPVAEHRFAIPRRWAFDFAWVEAKVALEIEGGIWISGRHSRGSGMLRDMEKYNEAAVRGWRVVRCTPTTIPTGVAAVARCLQPR